MGFIPALKIDKVVCGDGVIIKGEIVAGEASALQRFVKAFSGFLTDWRDRASKEQTEIDFSSGVTIPAVKLRADKPKLRAKEYSIGIDMTNVSMEDRSKLYAMSQDESKVLHISITAQQRHRSVSDAPAAEIPGETALPTAETESKIDECAPGSESSRPALIDHSAGKLELPTFIADTLEERLQVALLIREGAAERWAGRVKAGLTDRDLIKAIASEWAGELYESPDDGKHFIVQGGNVPRFRLAPAPGVRAQINNKPTLQGKALLAKTREVLGLAAPIPNAPSKGKATKDTVAA